MKTKKPLCLPIILFLVTILVSTSCVQLKKLNYFNDLEEISETTYNPRELKKIKAYDILYIRVISTDSETARLLNFYESGGQTSTTPVNVMGYTVDDNGDIDFPFAGKINVAGLTIDEAQITIHDTLSRYISNYSIIVRYLENKVSVLGEVNFPGVFTFTQDVLTVYEALAYASGIAESGDHKKVILIRQEGDKIMHYKMDLSDSQIANKSYYYIQPNDVIVVEPSRVASRTYNLPNFTTVLGIFTSILTLYMLVQQLTP